MIICLILGLILIGLGLCVHVFKIYGFVSGYSMLSEEKRKYVDIERIAEAIGIFLYSLGAFTILLGFYNSFMIIAIYVSYAIMGGIYITVFYERNNKSKDTNKT